MRFKSDAAPVPAHVFPVSGNVASTWSPCALAFLYWSDVLMQSVYPRLLPDGAVARGPALTFREVEIVPAAIEPFSRFSLNEGGATFCNCPQRAFLYAVFLPLSRAPTRGTASKGTNSQV